MWRKKNLNSSIISREKKLVKPSNFQNTATEQNNETSSSSIQNRSSSSTRRVLISKEEILLSPGTKSVQAQVFSTENNVADKQNEANLFATAEINTRLDMLEKQQRQHNVIVYGLEVQATDSHSTIIHKFVEKLHSAGINSIQESAFTGAFIRGKTVPRNREYYNNLLGLSSSSVFKNETPPKPPAVCIKCVNIDLRIALAMHWKTLKQQVGVNIYEDLTKAERDQRKLHQGDSTKTNAW